MWRRFASMLMQTHLIEASIEYGFHLKQNVDVAQPEAL